MTHFLDGDHNQWSKSARATFMERYTQVLEVPLCPEIHIPQAYDAIEIWQALEDIVGDFISPPYWAFCWPGGVALTRYLLDNPSFVAGKKVLDFAAGAGLCAIAAARGGATYVEAADIDFLAVHALYHNAALNDVCFTVLSNDIVGVETVHWDVVVAGDVCYERPMANRVFTWLQALARAGSLVLMADPGRDYLPTQGLHKLASYDVPARLDLENKPVRTTHIYQIV